jgi:hypothetical protein
MPVSSAPMSRLYLFCAACALFATGYGLAGLAPSQPMALLLWLGPAVAVAAWLAADGRRTRTLEAFDTGLFFYLTWPVSITWYALRTRGRAGWGLAAQLYALALAGLLGFLWGALLRGLLRLVLGHAG